MKQGPVELARSYESLLRDMQLTLLSEIGARSVYDHLARRVRDPQLKRLLERLNQEGAQQVARLQELIAEMGGRPRRTSFRRRALARILAHTTRLAGPRPALRICMNASETVSRWYAEYALLLVRIGDPGRAEQCEELRRVKVLHAQALGAWVSNIKRG